MVVQTEQLRAWAPQVLHLPPRLGGVAAGGLRRVYERRNLHAGYGKIAWELVRNRFQMSQEAQTLSLGHEIWTSEADGQRHLIVSSGEREFRGKAPLVVYNGYNTRPGNATHALQVMSYQTGLPVYGMFPPGYTRTHTRTGLTPAQVRAFQKEGPAAGFRLIARSQAAVIEEKVQMGGSSGLQITGDSMGTVMGIAFADALSHKPAKVVLSNAPVTEASMNRRVAALLQAEYENVGEQNFLSSPSKMRTARDILGILIRDKCLIYGSALNTKVFPDLVSEYLGHGGKFHHMIAELDELNRHEDIEKLYGTDGLFKQEVLDGSITLQVLPGEGHACMTNPWRRGYELNAILTPQADLVTEQEGCR